MEALLAIPGVREAMSLVDARLQPLVALLLLAAIVYLLSRAAHYVSLRHAREKVREAQRLEFATPHLYHTIDEPEPEAAPPDIDALLAAPPSAPPSGGIRLRPTHLIVSAVTVMFMAAMAMMVRPKAPETAPLESFGPPDDSAVAAADTAFRFEDAGSRAEKGACIETIRVTAISRTPRRLSLFIMDAAGAVIGHDVLESPAVTAGTMLDFRFPGIDCARVDEWQVQGEFVQN
jgi:hypothetical protein